MRVYKSVIILFLSVLISPFAFAGSSVETHTFSGFLNPAMVVSDDPSQDTICVVKDGLTLFGMPTFSYLYSGKSESCTTFDPPYPTLFSIDSFNKKPLANYGILSNSAGLYPVPLHLTYPIISGFITVYHLSSVPDETYTFFDGVICAEEMSISFNRRTIFLDVTQQITFKIDTKAEDLCSENLFKKYTHVQGIYQGYALSNDTSGYNYELPIFCSDIKVDVYDAENTDWTMGTFSLREKGSDLYGTGGLLSLELSKSSNVFTFTADYDVDTGMLNEYILSIDDNSSKAGGVAVKLICEDPILPNESLESCTNAEGVWHTGLNDCCYEESVGKVVSYEGDDYVCKQNTDSTGSVTYQWIQGVIDCSITSADGITLNGQRLATDEEYYCCVPGGYDADKPHKNNYTDPYFCYITSDDEAELTDNHEGIYNNHYWYGDKWNQCLGELTPYGEWLCHKDETQEPKLSACVCNNPSDTPSYDPGCGSSNTAGFCYCGQSISQESGGSLQAYYCGYDTVNEASYWTTDGTYACYDLQKVNNACCTIGRYDAEEFTDDGIIVTKGCFSSLFVTEIKGPEDISLPVVESVFGGLS